jgi:ATP-dependent DNA helicase RecQ
VQLLAPVREKTVAKVQKTAAFIELPPANKELLEELKALRQMIATSQGVALHNVIDEPTLYNMALELPVSSRDLKNIDGLSDTKSKKYGREFTTCIQHFIKQNPGIKKMESGRKMSSAELSMHYYNSGLSTIEIAKQRDLAESTIASHLTQYILSGNITDIDRLVSPERRETIETAIKKDGPELGKVMEKHPDKFGYSELRIVQAWMMRKDAEALAS